MKVAKRPFPQEQKTLFLFQTAPMLHEKWAIGNLSVDTRPVCPYSDLAMIRLANRQDAEQVHAIYAPIVRDTPISFELEVPTVAEMASRIEKVLATRPWLVYETAGDVLGYVYASTFRDRPAYNWGTEVTIYMRADARGRGLGRRLYTALFEVLRIQGYCTAVAGATVPNPGTERLHESLGFQLIGRYPGAGYKFNRWHDVAFYFLRLRPLPSNPPALIPISEIVGTKEWTNAIQAH
jgi:L-amino acid N-acyltransferase YncA